MRLLFGLLGSYILVAPLTDLISLDLRLTEWTNIMTYVIWLFAGAIWVVGFYLFVLIVAVALTWKDR